jgi:hypothetical protein
MASSLEEVKEFETIGARGILRGDIGRWRIVWKWAHMSSELPPSDEPQKVCEIRL